jgi:hypothetical protein
MNFTVLSLSSERPFRGNESSAALLRCFFTPDCSDGFENQHFSKRVGSVPLPDTKQAKDSLLPKGYFFTFAFIFQQNSGAKKNTVKNFGMRWEMLYSI